MSELTLDRWNKHNGSNAVVFKSEAMRAVPENNFIDNIKKIHSNSMDRNSRLFLNLNVNTLLFSARRDNDDCFLFFSALSRQQQ